MKLGLQGTIIGVSSGDSGVARRTGGCLGRNHTIFTGEPPSCPYVTAVGKTTLNDKSQSRNFEVAT